MEGELLYIDSSNSGVANADKNVICLNFEIKNVEQTAYQLKLSILDSPQEQMKEIGKHKK